MSAVDWILQDDFGFEDILYHKCEQGIAKVTINRPRVRNAFRPQTVFEMERAFADVRQDPEIGGAILTGAGGEAFCSGATRAVTKFRD